MLKTSNLGVTILASTAVLMACNAAKTVGADVLVAANTSTRYLVNVADPGIGTDWVEPDFDHGAWARGVFGIGHDEEPKSRGFVETEVRSDARSVYTRTTFVVGAVEQVHNLFVGANYDDGFVVWINGVEVARSVSMPAGEPRWDTAPSSHESTHALEPTRIPLKDISAVGIPALRPGENVLAVGVWNHGAGSRDLLLVPRLIANQPLGTFVTRGPYLQSGSDTAVTVRWRTDRLTDSQVTFGRPGSLDRKVADPQRTLNHELRIEGLEPDTIYRYTVGTTTAALQGSDAEHSFRTALAPGKRRPFRAWVLGDSGRAGFNVAAMRRGFEQYNRDRPISLWLMLGDNAYKHGTDAEYQTAVFDVFPDQLRRWVLWSTRGNHDNRRTYYDIFTFPTAGEAGGVPSGSEAYYAFDFGNVHFISLESEHSDPGAMLPWLERDLASTRADWIVAFFHYAPYSTGKHDSDVDPLMVEARTRLLPLLDAGGVDLVLTGHTHAYQRSALLRGHYGASDTLRPGMLVDAGDGRPEGTGPYRKPRARTANAGIVYVVLGSSGEATETDLHHPALPIAMTARGSMILEFDGDRLDAQFVDWRGEAPDHFAIVKE